MPDKSIASLVKYYYSWKKTRQRTSVMDRQEKLKSKECLENGSENGSNDDSDTEEKVRPHFILLENCLLYGARFHRSSVTRICLSFTNRFFFVPFSENEREYRLLFWVGLIRMNDVNDMNVLTACNLYCIL